MPPPKPDYLQVLEEIDVPTAELILRLQMEDLDSGDSDSAVSSQIESEDVVIDEGVESDEEIESDEDVESDVEVQSDENVDHELVDPDEYMITEESGSSEETEESIESDDEPYHSTDEHISSRASSRASGNATALRGDEAEYDHPRETEPSSDDDRPSRIASYFLNMRNQDHGVHPGSVASENHHVGPARGLSGQNHLPTSQPRALQAIGHSTSQLTSQQSSSTPQTAFTTQTIPTPQMAYTPHMISTQSQTAAVQEKPTQNGSNESTCVVCAETVAKEESRSMACGHSHCQACLNRAFSLALKDRSNYPPRCCGSQTIQFRQVKPLLGYDLAIAFEEVIEELDDPKPSYCFKPSCSAYIPAASKSGASGRCQKCFDSTCILCKQQWHSGDCQNDDETQRTLQIAKDMEWQRCSSCQRIVELATGCNHITCRCGFQFCYVCRAKWKTCGCEQFNERRLLAGGERIR